MSREPGSLLARFTDAFERADVTALVAMLTSDAWLTMPPLPFSYRGPEAAARLLSALVFRGGTRRFTLAPTRANGQPAFGVYVRDPATGVFHANGMLVVTLAGDRVRAMTRFDNSMIARFGLPRRLL